MLVIFGGYALSSSYWNNMMAVTLGLHGCACGYVYLVVRFHLMGMAMAMLLWSLLFLST